jgi:hypothetical protein
MPTYHVRLTETTERDLNVKAHSMDDARDLVEKTYRESDIFRQFIEDAVDHDIKVFRPSRLKTDRLWVRNEDGLLEVR